MYHHHLHHGQTSGGLSPNFSSSGDINASSSAAFTPPPEFALQQGYHHASWSSCPQADSPWTGYPYHGYQQHQQPLTPPPQGDCAPYSSAQFFNCECRVVWDKQIIVAFLIYNIFYSRQLAVCLHQCVVPATTASATASTGLRSRVPPESCAALSRSLLLLFLLRPKPTTALPVRLSQPGRR